MSIVSVIINGHQYGIAEEFITHYGTVVQATITRQVMSIRDELHDLGSGPENTNRFFELLDGCGIPRNVVNEGKVLNPQSGEFEGNGTWSRRREILANQALQDQKLNQILEALKQTK